MTDIAYKPTSEYKPQLNTPITSFNLNLLSGIITAGTRVIISDEDDTATHADDIIYTVPQGKTFFITSIVQLVYAQGTVCYLNAISIGLLAERKILTNLMTKLTETTTSLVQTYPIPVILMTGEKICFNKSVATHAHYCIIGYEMVTANLPRYQ